MTSAVPRNKSATAECKRYVTARRRFAIASKRGVERSILSITCVASPFSFGYRMALSKMDQNSDKSGVYVSLKSLITKFCARIPVK